MLIDFSYGYNPGVINNKIFWATVYVEKMN